MPEATCLHNWCDTDHATEEPGLHESRVVRVAGVPTGFGVPYLQTTVTYCDTEGAPRLYFSGNNVRLDVDNLDELINVLQEQRLIMHAAQSTPVPVFA